MQHRENGWIYRNEAQLYRAVKQLLADPEQAHGLGNAAYRTVRELWNAEVAAERLLRLLQALCDGEKVDALYPEGPCSVAPQVREDWFLG